MFLSFFCLTHSVLIDISGQDVQYQQPLAVKYLTSGAA
nr:MAG TPA: hypothetical protein [Caudoviricetes sp.]